MTRQSLLKPIAIQLQLFQCSWKSGETMATDSKELFAKRLEGKVALITGGANGIGAATARLFSLHGARLVLADIDDDEGHSLASTLGGSAYATYVHCDVTDEAQVAAAVDAAVATYGTIDIVYANAGIMDTPYRTLDCLDLASFERTMAVNVTGVFLTLKHAARVMKAAGRRGGIVVTASIAAVMAGITPHAYTCSKHALLGLVRNAAAELGMYGIRVNAVSPSALASKQSCSALGLAPQEVEQIVRDKAPLRGEVVEPLRADDIAEAVLFLSCEQSKYISGHNLIVDGGITVTNSTLISVEQLTHS